jgi:hypothetical protein
MGELNEKFVYDNDDWKPLFGSAGTDATYDKTAWNFNDGVWSASEDKVLWANGEYENFILKLDFKNENGSNSGVIVYCTNTADWIPNSVEIQIADDHSEKWGNSQKDFQCAAVFGHLPASKQKVVKVPGEWNTMEIKCKGKMIDVTLNGENVTSMDMNLWTSGSTNPDGSKIPSWLPKPFSTLPTKGAIGFQGKHGDAAIHFRNVLIKEI